MVLFKNKYKTESNRLKNWDYSSKAIYFITIVTKNRESIFGDILDMKMILNDNGKIIKNELLKSIQIRDRWFFHNWVIMPNHIHLLIEIVSTNAMDSQNDNTDNSVETHVETHCSASLRTQRSPLNEPTKKILPDYTDIEIVKSFISYDAYLSYIKSIDDLKTNNVVETHCSASLRASLPPNQSKINSLSRKPDSISSFVAIFKSITTKQINRLTESNNCDSIWQSNYHDHIVKDYNSFDKIYYYIKNNPKNWDTDSINSIE
ncbi:transposase [Flavobacterium aquicola]|uniref:Transposase IS200 family protein n=1 Tax=Flavobacterium aquicola TaxID=1682742 RepID=A0A3E0ELA3_9FLAO|nr:transposase [Flavobacterium aquicola]REG97896.1 transposase IS200 family protein [Flavobacterium aquicola]